MNAYLLLVAECLLSIAITLAVLRVLAGPLVSLLGRICPSEPAAAFWLSYTKLMLILAPLLLVLLVDLCSRYNDPFDGLRLALIAALGGLLAGLHVIGGRLGHFETLPAQTGSGQA